MPAPHRYHRVFAIFFAGATLATVLAAASLNYVVDPYSVFGARIVAGFNEIKPRPDVMLSDIKSIAGTRFRPDALILGNSRAEVGFDPRHPAINARHLRGFNAAIPGAGMEYSSAALRRFANSAKIRLAIVGVDFLDFLYAPNETVEPPAIPRTFIASSTLTRLTALFSTTALLDSIKTVAIQRQANPASLRADGFNPMFDYREIAASEGYSALFHQRAQESARKLADEPHNLYVGGKHASPSYSALGDLMRSAGDIDTELFVVIYPYHLLLLLQFQEAGLWPLFEQWKADIAAITDSARSHGMRVVLWDFGCPNDFTAEPIPADGDIRATTRWYWEAGHFKKELGDLVLSRMLGQETHEDVQRFGAKLTMANLDDRNTECRTALLEKRYQFPNLVRDVAKLAKTTHVGH